MGATVTTFRPRRTATPERWRAALERALAEGVQVRQVCGSGLWVATSGTNPGTAYALAVTDGIAHGCDCPAGAHDDPVCKHRAAFYHAAGLLDLDPEPEPTAPAALPAGRVACDGCGRVGLVLQDKPVPSPFHCRACRPVETPAAVVTDADALAFAAFVAAHEDDERDHLAA